MSNYCKPEAPVMAGRSGRGSTSGSEAADKIERSIRYMAEHLDQPLQVARLAALVHVSPSHYFALFKRCTGCAPIEFFIRLRMEQACWMLETTALNVKEVAATLGYDDPFYFSRVFKSVNCVAPSDYRELSDEQRSSIREAACPGMPTPDLDEPVSQQWWMASGAEVESTEYERRTAFSQA